MHENLRGKGIFIHAQLALGLSCNLGNFCKEIGMDPVVNELSRFPEDLQGFMVQGEIDCAIIHTRALIYCDPIIEAHKSGLKIVYVRQMSPLTEDEEFLQEKLGEAGVPYVAKGKGCHFVALAKLNKMFGEE